MEPASPSACVSASLSLKPAGINVEPLWSGLFAKALANVNIRSLICNEGVGGPTPAAGAVSARGPAPSTTAVPAEEKKAETQKEESEDSDDATALVFLIKPLL
ncbi:unnamed protein product [Nyctereutes procyonoides]|uniref:(raccoon dog) hypothetical protein n=1 Tax=Nyctereutes procyonoides TaxID=34880 RepID=A0A811ZWQ1_NYCPR|nr:unnamed protein product [Nyctereutes procyonoides]